MWLDDEKCKISVISDILSVNDEHVGKPWQHNDSKNSWNSLYIITSIFYRKAFTCSLILDMYWIL